MALRTVAYLGYEIDILGPPKLGAGWIVTVWPPNRKAPVVLAPDPSEAKAIEAAITVVDEMLGEP